MFISKLFVACIIIISKYFYGKITYIVLISYKNKLVINFSLTYDYVYVVRSMFIIVNDFGPYKKQICVRMTLSEKCVLICLFIFDGMILIRFTLKQAVFFFKSHWKRSSWIHWILSHLRISWKLVVQDFTFTEQIKVPK